MLLIWVGRLLAWRRRSERNGLGTVIRFRHGYVRTSACLENVGVGEKKIWPWHGRGRAEKGRGCGNSSLETIN